MVSVLCHVYYHHLWPEVCDNISKIKDDFRLYVNLVNDSDGISTVIKSRFPDARILVSPNQGKDTGGNLRLIAQWLKDGAPGELIYQCHAKHDTNWRRELFRVFDNSDYVKYLFKDTRLGMIGDANWLIIRSNDVNTAFYDEYRRQFGMNMSRPMKFFGGTIFCVRASIFKEFFSQFDPIEIANSLEHGNIYEPSKTHAWERLFGGIVMEKGYFIKPYAKNLIDLFDEQYYVAAYPDANNAAFDHFIKYGRFQGRRMNKMLFDENYYLQNNPDVANAVHKGEFKSGYCHFLLNGHAENRKFKYHPVENIVKPNMVFDGEYYADNNLDVLESMKCGWPRTPYDHFLLFGHAENRKFGWKEKEPEYTKLPRQDNKKSLCLFSHYSTQERLPKYVRRYLKELSRHFDEVKLLTNRDLETKYDLTIVENEGLDHGMWKKGLAKINSSDYYRIALVNDTVTLFDTLDHIFKWADQQKFDFWGLTDSFEPVPIVSWPEKHQAWSVIMQQPYHIQSYFRVFEEKSLNLLVNFFKRYPIYNVEPFPLRVATIIEGEIGLSKLLIESGMKHGVFVSTLDLTNNEKRPINPNFYFWKQLIARKLPIIKNKIIDGRITEDRNLPPLDFSNWHVEINKRMKWAYDEVFSDGVI